MPFQVTDCHDVKSLHEIQKGEELLDIYFFFGDKTYFEAYLAELRAVCWSEVGLVNAFEAGLPTKMNLTENDWIALSLPVYFVFISFITVV